MGKRITNGRQTMFKRFFSKPKPVQTLDDATARLIANTANLLNR